MPKAALFAAKKPMRSKGKATTPPAAVAARLSTPAEQAGAPMFKRGGKVKKGKK